MAMAKIELLGTDTPNNKKRKKKKKQRKINLQLKNDSTYKRYEHKVV